MASNKCISCCKTIRSNQKSVQCSCCKNHFHVKCTSLDLIRYDQSVYYDSLSSWLCQFCIIDFFPFSTLNESELTALNNFSRLSNFDLLPSFAIQSKLSGVPNLNDFDNEYSLPNPVNSPYLFLDNLNRIKSFYTNKCFS